MDIPKKRKPVRTGLKLKKAGRELIELPKEGGFFTRETVKGFKKGRGGELMKALGEYDERSVDLFQDDRALRHPYKTPHAYLAEVRGLSERSIQNIMRKYPAASWEERKQSVIDAVCARASERNADLTAQALEQQAAVSRVIMAKALQFTNKLEVQDRPVFVVGDDGKKVRIFGLRASDLKNVADALKSSSDVYRKAMGIKDGSTPEEIRAAVAAGQAVNQTNVQINIGGTEGTVSEVDKALSELTYDQVFDLIEMKRKQLVAPVENADEVKATVSESVDSHEKK